MRRSILVVIGLSLIMASCGKSLMDARVDENMHYFSKSYAVEPNDAYYALRWALEESGFPVESENLPQGVIKTAWLPVTSDSHYVEVFGRRDYGVTNSYHQLEMHVSRMGGRTLVKVGSRPKTLAARFKSSGVLEHDLLERVGNYVRKQEPQLTNLGINE